MALSLVQVRERLKTEVVKEMQTISNKLSAGRAMSFDHYQKMVGMIAGGQMALDKIDEAFKGLFNEGDDE
jgi:hypothetical protein